MFPTPTLTKHLWFNLLTSPSIVWTFWNVPDEKAVLFLFRTDKLLALSIFMMYVAVRFLVFLLVGFILCSTGHIWQPKQIKSSTVGSRLLQEMKSLLWRLFWIWMGYLFCSENPIFFRMEIWLRVFCFCKVSKSVLMHNLQIKHQFLFGPNFN